MIFHGMKYFPKDGFHPQDHSQLISHQLVLWIRDQIENFHPINICLQPKFFYWKARTQKNGIFFQQRNWKLESDYWKAQNQDLNKNGGGSVLLTNDATNIRKIISLLAVDPIFNIGDFNCECSLTKFLQLSSQFFFFGKALLRKAISSGVCVCVGCVSVLFNFIMNFCLLYQRAVTWRILLKIIKESSKLHVLIELLCYSY